MDANKLDMCKIAKNKSICVNFDQLGNYIF